jgi:hypothetical protein
MAFNCDEYLRVDKLARSVALGARGAMFAKEL